MGKTMTRQEFLEGTIARAWRCVDRRSPDECWPWTGTVSSHGYGYFSIFDGKTISYRAHRIIWMLTNGEIPDGHVIMHTCDNPICVNPAHLECGTMADNMKDCRDKWRHAFGEKAGQTRITEAQAMEALESDKPPSVLGKKFGVHPSVINKIRQGINWRHLHQGVSSTDE